jgi:molecular chaperone HtpG
MTISLKYSSEERARQASDLPAFSGVDVLHIKRQVGQLLDLIGGHGIFDEYTLHNVTHIETMISMLEWIIPEDTKRRMSIADWLMSVLGIYFHDLGMLVTKKEYSARNLSGYPEFRDRVLFTDDSDGGDYKAKVLSLSLDEAERLLYQEFVRDNHARRIRAWIQGQERTQLGISEDAAREVDRLLNPLDSTFRDDLGLICESHHLDDLDDLEKYKVSRPYGDSDDETANLQYAAVLLRTVDLLDISRGRTPAIMFRTINPSDPISQREWAKQMAVRRVRDQFGRDKENNLDENAPRNTIEVHATFEDAEGFFGLTSYLAYAEQQLKQSHEWVTTSSKALASKHAFPWRYCLSNSNSR